MVIKDVYDKALFQCFKSITLQNMDPTQELLYLQWKISLFKSVQLIDKNREEWVDFWISD